MALTYEQAYEHFKERVHAIFKREYEISQEKGIDYFTQLWDSGGPYEHMSPLNVLLRSRLCLEGFKKNSESDTAQGLEIEDINQRDGLEYLAGRLAKKYNAKHPYLARYDDRNLPIEFDLDRVPNWMRRLVPKGGFEPSFAWLIQVYIFENHFFEYHCSYPNDEPGIVEKIAEFIKERISVEGGKGVPEELIKGFCTIRSLIRMSYLTSLTLKRRLGDTCQFKRKKVRRCIH